MYRCEVNHNFFKEINNELNSYWLGYMYADGNVCIRNTKYNKQRFVVSLCSKDIEHLNKFKKHIQSTHKIGLWKEKQTLFEYGKISIDSKVLAQDLINLGCLPQKSLILKFPNYCQVPNNLLCHFLRGYFDGDGCIKYDKNGYSYSVLGTLDFLSDMNDYLHSKIKLTNRQIYPTQTKVYNLGYYNKYDISLLYQYFYKDATIYLDRKYDKFQELIKYFNQPKISRIYPKIYCKVPNCDKIQCGLHLCQRHYDQFKRHGKVLDYARI